MVLGIRRMQYNLGQVSLRRERMKCLKKVLVCITLFTFMLLILQAGTAIASLSELSKQLDDEAKSENRDDHLEVKMVFKKLVDLLIFLPVLGFVTLALTTKRFAKVFVFIITLWYIMSFVLMSPLVSDTRLSNDELKDERNYFDRGYFCEDMEESRKTNGNHYMFTKEEVRYCKASHGFAAIIVFYTFSGFMTSFIFLAFFPDPPESQAQVVPIIHGTRH